MVRNQVDQGKTSFAAVRIAYLRHILCLLHGKPTVEELSLELAICATSQDIEGATKALRERFPNDLPQATVPIPAIDPAEVVPDADPEDLTSPWQPIAAPLQEAQTQWPASSSTRVPVPQPVASSSATVPMPEPVALSSTNVPVPAQGEDRDAGAVRLPRYSPENRDALDEDGQPCSHYRRASPPSVSCWTKEAKKWVLPSLVSIDDDYKVAHDLVRGWISQRQELASRVRNVEARSYEWFEDIDSGRPLSSTVHSYGQWFWCPLVDWQPRHPLGKEATEVMLRMRRYRPAIHACSLYTLQRSVVRGVQPGPVPGKSGRRGIYCFETSGEPKALASSQYSVYSDVGYNLVMAPRLHLAIDKDQAGSAEVGSISVGGGQWLVQPCNSWLVGFWMHVLTKADAFRMEGWCQYDAWHPEYELNP